MANEEDIPLVAVVTSGRDGADLLGNIQPTTMGSLPNPITPETYEQSQPYLVPKQTKNAQKKDVLNAAKAGNTEELARLVEADPSLLDATDDTGGTLLHLATKSLHLKCSEYLLNKKPALVKHTDKIGNTPLHSAIFGGKSSTYVAELLLQRGANSNVANRKKQIPLHLAAEKGNVDLLKTLLSKTDNIEAKDSQSQTALHLAAKNGHTICCQELVRTGADVNQVDHKNQTPLHLAAKRRFNECCEELIKLRAAVNAVDKEGNTPLHLFCGSCNSQFSSSDQCAVILLSNGADPNIQNKKGETPVHKAKKAPNEVLRAFQNYNLDMTLVDSSGSTILHNAANRNMPTCCEVLIDMCKRKGYFIQDFIDSVNKDGQTPLHVAIRGKRNETCKILIKAGADGNIVFTDGHLSGNALHHAADLGLQDVCDLLITKGTVTEIANAEGNNPVHLAAKRGHAEVCTVLVRKNTNVAATNAKGMTPLHIAAKHKHGKCCKLFLEKHSHLVNKKENSGKTPLHHAVESSSPKSLQQDNSQNTTQQRKVVASIECCKALLTDRADVWAKDNAGHSAVWYTFDSGNDELFGILLDHAKTLKEGDVDLRECLSVAIDEERRHCCEVIVKSRQWEAAFRPKTCESKLVVEKLQNNNLRQLVKVFPDVAKLVLDRCRVEQKDSEEVLYMFQYVEESYTNSSGGSGHQPPHDLEVQPQKPKWRSLGKGRVESIDHKWMEDHLFKWMARHHPHLLHHPVSKTLRDHKWNKYACFTYYFFITMFIMHAVLLSVITFTAGSWSWATTEFTGQFPQSVVCPPNGTRLVGPEIDEALAAKVSFSSNLTIAVAVVMACLLVHRIYKSIKLRKLPIGFHEFLMITAVGLDIAFLGRFTKCSQSTHQLEDYQWFIGIAALWTAWVIVCLELMKSPSCSSLFLRVYQVKKRSVFSMTVIIGIVVIGLYYGLKEDSLPKPDLVVKVKDIACIIILCIFGLVLLVMMLMNGSECSCLNRSREPKVNFQRCLTSVNIVLETDVLYPFLRHYFYESEITTDEDQQLCSPLDSITCGFCRSNGKTRDMPSDSPGEPAGQFEEIKQDLDILKEQMKLLMDNVNNMHYESKKEV